MTLTLDEVNAREQTCRRCGGRWLAAIPNEPLPGDPIARIRRLRELTGCSLGDAKAILHHASAGTVCHWRFRRSGSRTARAAVR